MEHLKPFKAREIIAMPLVRDGDWRLKQYAVLSDGRTFEPTIAEAAQKAALERMPKAGELDDAHDNHGVGFQIVHFAQVAVVSPVFYWQWGSVLANLTQLRAPWDNPLSFDDGIEKVIGCVWELEILKFETQAWQEIMLGDGGAAAERLARYLDAVLPSALSPA